MRRSLAGLAVLSGTLGAIAACATTGDDDPSRQPPADPGDSGGAVLGDAAPRDAGSDGFGETPVCSPAGWCRTELPVSELSLGDVWPVGSRAFATATSTAHGIKFLEWDSSGGWKFIDKKLGFSRLVSPANVWAPDENEVFVALSDVSGFIGGGTIGAIVMHGTRPIAPETAWSWTRSRIDCPNLDFNRASPALWGAGRDEVYTAVCGSIYRHERTAIDADSGVDGGDAGTAGGDLWELEYTVDGSDFHSWQGVTGTGTGDVWFVGARALAIEQCVVLVRKTSAGYATAVDGVPTEEGCVAKPGVAMIRGRLSQVVAPAKDRLVGVGARGWSPEVDNDMVHVAIVGSEVQIKRASPASTMDVALTSVWGTSPDDLWTLATRGGPNLIVRATSAWEDAGKFEFSTLAINGAPNLATLTRIRGTSNQNIWAVGGERAYFKSTP